jgi:hypothetical protein
MQNNQRLTDEEQDRLKSIMQKAAVAQSKLAGGALAASRDMDDASGGMIEAIGLNQGAHKATAAEQEKAAKSTDGMNKTVNDAKASLAEFSNSFSMALVNSGLLGTLLEAFQFTANFMMSYVVPLFQVLATSVGRVVSSFIDSFGPAINDAGGFFNGVLIPAIRAFTDFLVIDLIPAVAKTFNDLRPVLEFLAGAVMVVAKFITDNLTAVLVTVGTGLLAYYAILGVVTIANFLEAASKNVLVLSTYELIKSTLAASGSFIRSSAIFIASALQTAATFMLVHWPITLAVAAVVALIAIFKHFGGDVSVVKDGLLIMWDGFKMFLNYFKLGLLNVLDYVSDQKDAIKQTEADIAANKKDAADRADKITATMAANRKAAEDERIAEEKRERNEEAKKLKADQARNQPKPSSSSSMGGMGGMGGSSGTASSSPEIPGMDYNLTGDAALKQFAEREKASPMAAADTTRKQIEANAEKKTAETAANTKAEEDRKKQQEQKPQENPSVLLAELNNKMAQMIKLQTQTTTNTYENVLATKGLNNNLYKA